MASSVSWGDVSLKSHELKSWGVPLPPGASGCLNVEKRRPIPVPTAPCSGWETQLAPETCPSPQLLTLSSTESGQEAHGLHQRLPASDSVWMGAPGQLHLLAQQRPSPMPTEPFSTHPCTAHQSSQNNPNQDEHLFFLITTKCTTKKSEDDSCCTFVVLSDQKTKQQNTRVRQ